jgi:hypothetical protein
VQVFRDGLAVGPCDGGTAAASPDPCVASRHELAGGGAELVVRTSHASAWNFGKRDPFAVSSFFQPVDNLPTTNTVKAGSSIPVKFSLGGNQGFNVLAHGSPASQRTDCVSGSAADAIETTASAGSSSLSYDAASGQYTYVWKTAKTWSTAPNGPCRQLTVKLIDGSVLRANFRFDR